jgi:hypothetical protein
VATARPPDELDRPRVEREGLRRRRHPRPRQIDLALPQRHTQTVRRLQQNVAMKRIGLLGVVELAPAG